MTRQYEIDPISSVKLSKIIVPLANPISDAKVITGRQRPLASVALLIAQVYTHQGREGLGFSHSSSDPASCRHRGWAGTV